MKKTLIAMAVLAASGAAFAQSNVTIYGIADVGFVKSSHVPVYMDENVNNRLGFKGSEDLGNGLKATFNLEHRFDLFDGAERGGVMFDGASNIGLQGAFGHVRVGRMNQISTETYRALDPFYQYGVAGMVESAIREARISNTVRWDSMNFSGFNVSASYSLKTGGAGDYIGDHAGYAVGATYKNGPVYLVANYNRAASAVSTDDGLSKDYNWNVGGAYAFGPARLSLGFEETKLKNADAKQKNWLVGLEYTVGAGRINVAYSQGKFNNGFNNGAVLGVDGLDATVIGGVYFPAVDAVDGSTGVNKQQKYAIGYTHNLSKRTAVYANYAHDKISWEVDQVNAVSGSESVNSVQVGMTHKF